jgi:release factor glutamine methyltransferase
MSVALEQLLREAVSHFERAGVPEAEAEAERLASVALEVGDSSEPGGEATEVTAEFLELVRLRSARVPLERLLGCVRFRHIELLVGDGVFVPQPESEPVVQWCVDALLREGMSRPRLVDLCTGSGAIALALANEISGAEVHAVELSPAAFAWTRQNADRRVADGDQPTTLHLGDIVDALHDLDGTFDLVASNPPYVADHELAGLAPEVLDHDPLVAIQAGHDGLDLVRRVERVARRLLRDGGLVVVEHSDRQGRTAPAVFAAAGGWFEIEDHCDQPGRDRFLTARWRPAKTS